MNHRLRITALCVALLLAVSALNTCQTARMQRAQRCFARNEEALQALAQRFDAGERAALTKNGLHGVQRICVVANPARLEIHTGAFGIAPASTYSGLYYSPTDEPMAFDSGAALQEEEEGWSWHGVGDNRGMTCRICKNWFYFEASF